MEGPRQERAGPDLEVDVDGIIEVLSRHGLDEGQPGQVAGRWVEAGIEEPAEIEGLIERGLTKPEHAAGQRRVDAAPAGERHREEKPRDVVRGTTGSRSWPGDELEREP